MIDEFVLGSIPLSVLQNKKTDQRNDLPLENMRYLVSRANRYGVVTGTTVPATAPGAITQLEQGQATCCIVTFPAIVGI